MDWYGEESLPELPPKESLHHLWQLLGRYQPGLDGGAFPVSWLELDAFLRVRKIELTQAEADTLITMSRAYCIWSRKTDPHSKSPVKRHSDAD